MHDKTPDPRYYPKQYRRPQSATPPTPRTATNAPLPPSRLKIPCEPFWKHPLYLAIWERLPNSLQIRLLEYEARLEQRQQQPR
ncbi:hypothetical protein BTM_2734 [Burkholderia thailandensis 34]|nr:hypothetical protein BTM_2734 [Burkholderia thailandensis 34]